MRFDAKAFGFLNDDCQYMPGWSNVTHEELKLSLEYLIAQGIKEEDAPDVFHAVLAFNEFMNAIGLPETTGSVLGVKIDEGDLLEQVNGPAIFADEGAIVLRVGDHKVPVEMNGVSAKIGVLEGDVTVTEHGEGDEKYCGITFEYFSPVVEDSIELSFVLDVKERPEIAKLSKGKLKKTVKDGGLCELLRAMPSGESFVKPRDLEVGEYSVVSISENDPHEEYGRSWKVVLEGIGAMMTTGKRLNATLARQSGIYTKWLNNGKPLTFAISKKEEMSQGIRVDCGFFKREPKAARLVAAAKAIAPMPVAEALPEAATKTVEVTAEPVQAGLPVDDIPF